MWIIAFVGGLMIALSAGMIWSPQSWADAIVAFSNKSYFHPAEIVTRLAGGTVFVYFAEQTLFPRVILAAGYLLLAVGVGLLLTPPSRHRQFALWTAAHCIGIFRPAGFVSVLFGGFLIYAVIGV